MLTAATDPRDKAIVALLFMGGLRRSEAAALRWGDLEDREDGLLLVRVQASKTNPDGTTADLRMLKGAFAQALRDLRPENASDSDPVIGLKGQRPSLTSCAKKL